MQRVNYDQIADMYNQRYRANSLAGVENSLVQLVRDVNAKMMLEVGCGTGRWLDGLAKHFPGAQFYGLDYSQGMLAQAQDQSILLYLIRGKGSELPLKAHTIDLLFCVNAFHHFDNPKNFIFQANQLLRPGGTLAIIGQTPQDRRNHWFVYDYFQGTFEHDLERFLSWGTIMDWMVSASFYKIQGKTVEWIIDDKLGWAVLDDPFLQKHAVSQLAMLSDDAYIVGIQRTKKAIRRAESAGQMIKFKTQLRLDMTTATPNIKFTTI